MTTDAQDSVIKQLEDRYEVMTAVPIYADGQTQGEADYEVTARYYGIGSILWERKLVISPTGLIVSDTDDQEIASYGD